MSLKYILIISIIIMCKNTIDSDDINMKGSHVVYDANKIMLNEKK